MTELDHPRRPLHSISAIVAGLLFIFIVTTIVDVVLHATGVFPPWGQSMSDGLFGLATAYRIVFSVVGCYIAARLAPDRAMGHALVLGGDWGCDQCDRGGGYLESGAGVWAALVSAAADRDLDSVRVDWRETFREVNFRFTPASFFGFTQRL